MAEVVRWSETDVPDQVFGFVGEVDLFIVGKEARSGVYRLAIRDPFTTDGRWVQFSDAEYVTQEEAKRAAEERLEWVLNLLRLVPRESCATS